MKCKRLVYIHTGRVTGGDDHSRDEHNGQDDEVGNVLQPCKKAKRGNNSQHKSPKVSSGKKSNRKLSEG